MRPLLWNESRVMYILSVLRLGGRGVRMHGNHIKIEGENIHDFF